MQEKTGTFFCEGVYGVEGLVEVPKEDHGIGPWVLEVVKNEV